MPRQIESRRGVTGADADARARSDHRRRREGRAGEGGGEGKAPQDNNISDIGRMRGSAGRTAGERASEAMTDRRVLPRLRGNYSANMEREGGRGRDEGDRMVHVDERKCWISPGGIHSAQAMSQEKN